MRVPTGGPRTDRLPFSVVPVAFRRDARNSREVTMAMDLGKVGVWWSASWRRADDGSTDVAAELEALGYGALWSSGGFERGLAKRFEHLLSATSRVAVASGIVSIWATSPADVAPAVAELDALYPGRFVLGLGASHAAIVENYDRP